MQETLTNDWSIAARQWVQERPRSSLIVSASKDSMLSLGKKQDEKDGKPAVRLLASVPSLEKNPVGSL